MDLKHANDGLTGGNLPTPGNGEALTEQVSAVAPVPWRAAIRTTGVLTEALNHLAVLHLPSRLPQVCALRQSGSMASPEFTTSDAQRGRRTVFELMSEMSSQGRTDCQLYRPWCG